MKFLNNYDPLKNQRVEIMDKDGVIVDQKLFTGIDDKFILESYKLMNLSRTQDIYQNKVQRQGRILSFLSSTGQEACEVAYIKALNMKTDHFLSGYRNNAAWLACGQEVKNIMLYWMGNEMGGRTPDGVNCLPPNIVIGTQYSQAAGMAFAEKFLKRKGVVLTTTGDGGMSEGETYESMNFAKLHNVPCVFVCENNKWAISTPTAEQTKTVNIAVKAVASAIPSIKVDGNDFVASYLVTKEIVDWVRAGNGPAFIEYDTYRLGAHSSSDSPDIYRPKGEFEKMQAFDPLVRLKKYLITKKVWSDKQQEKLDNEQLEFVAKQFTWAETNKNYPLEDIFKYQYSELTDNLKEQQKEASEFFKKYPETLKRGH
ncbi:thiamine pyrophosphate-dependent dehydrogenase E1 component subunit alpha [Spiroplasma endosymbiont of Aspidapion aeneum]|uniref:thiamine pyrophosphate-dependent dehydrogenase E1 component subunit alpha n=1 Tax=Spiroplasma endosymbiont of Aspidapion aeneum TaxID=3066276 RepID=UPI00313B2E8D